jgi:hypothetical protein
MGDNQNPRNKIAGLTIGRGGAKIKASLPFCILCSTPCWFFDTFVYNFRGLQRFFSLAATRPQTLQKYSPFFMRSLYSLGLVI